MLPSGRQRSGAFIDDTLRARNEEAGLHGRAPRAGDFPRQRVELFRGPGAAGAIQGTFRDRGWTDGLPVNPPTTGAVAELVAALRRPPVEVLGELAPLGGMATVEKVAANAVMAGCGPAQFPFVAAAVQAMADPAFNLAGVQTTDENVTPLLIVSAPGPVREGAQIHAGVGVLGPGWRGNATIGRAVRLVLHNIGGGWPGAVSYAGAGQPGRYTLCIAEDDEACPWPPLRVELGWAEADSTITVLRAESAVNVTGGVAEILSVMSSATSLFNAAHRGRAAVLLAPHTAAGLAARGLSRRDAAELLARATIPTALWRQSWLAAALKGNTRFGDMAVVADPADLTIVVAGGTVPIAQHVWFPSWGFPPAALTRRV